MLDFNSIMAITTCISQICTFSRNNDTIFMGRGRGAIPWIDHISVGRWEGGLDDVAVNVFFFCMRYQ